MTWKSMLALVLPAACGRTRTRSSTAAVAAQRPCQQEPAEGARAGDHGRRQPGLIHEATIHRIEGRSGDRLVDRPQLGMPFSKSRGHADSF